MHKWSNVRSIQYTLLPGRGCACTGDGRRLSGADDVGERGHHDGELVLLVVVARRRNGNAGSLLPDDRRPSMAMAVTSLLRRRRRRTRRWHRTSVVATVRRSRGRSASASARMIHACCPAGCHRRPAPPADRQDKVSKARSMDNADVSCFGFGFGFGLA